MRLPLFALVGLLPLSVTPAVTQEPIVYSKAGIFHGRHLPTFEQDVYLGIKYAPKPVRFATAKLIANSPRKHYNASQYGVDCTGYGSDTNALVKDGWTTLGEDCLHLNIVRPRIEDRNQSFPVLLWIYGGGWQQGATSDPRYNLSYIVEQSTLNNKPVLAISINYRMAAFGFLNGKDVAPQNLNLGLRDQRLALQWVNKHISAFGGDPRKVTIWGESAGAYSVGDHINAFDGDSGGLFRAAILESGNAVGPPMNGSNWYQHMYDNLASSVGCAGANNTLQCMRDVPYDKIAPYGYVGPEWFHAIDGTFIARYGQQSLTQGKFAKIPLILGTTTDEGFGVNGVDTDAQALAQLTTSKRWNLDTSQAEQLLALYPDDPAVGAPYGWGNRTWPALGKQYKRYTSMATDLTMFAPRRLLAERMSEYVDNVYSYRWDAPRFNSTPANIGVGHFSEIPFVFANPSNTLTPLGNSTADLRLSHLVARMWTSFAYDLDPNGHGVKGIAAWPRYHADLDVAAISKKNDTQPGTNFVFRADRSYVEEDKDRREGVAYINSIIR